jgi:hypothetical protein
MGGLLETDIQVQMSLDSLLLGAYLGVYNTWLNLCVLMCVVPGSRVL